ncbi:AraC family transcriptional regulator [Escherichia coli]|nr:AraC family transcriptional regulator [Escherichia coli]
MYHDVSYLLSRLINGPLSLRQIYFASSNGPVPDLAYQVDFPRLEIVLEGEFVDTGAGATLVPAMCCTFLLVAGIFHNGKPPLLPLACCLANSNSASASCNGMANNIKIWRSNTSPDAAHA